MGYSIEVSINLIKANNILQIEETIFELANKYNVEYINNYYDNTDIIYDIRFNEIDKINCNHFIDILKKIKNINIDCIYENCLLCKMIYKSKKYNENFIYNKMKNKII